MGVCVLWLRAGVESNSSSSGAVGWDFMLFRFTTRENKEVYTLLKCLIKGKQAPSAVGRLLQLFLLVFTADAWHISDGP